MSEATESAPLSPLALCSPDECFSHPGFSSWPRTPDEKSTHPGYSAPGEGALSVASAKGERYMYNLIFEISRKGRSAKSQWPSKVLAECDDIPAEMLRKDVPNLPETSELQVVRHYTNLSRKNFSIDTHFYPLGSCTMKYNPRGVRALASLDGFLNHHPLSLDENSQGYMACAYELQEMLKSVTGMKAAALAPMAGAQGEFAGVAMIAAYHRARNDFARDEILVPDAAHGTNPASAVQCGFKVHEIPTGADGNVDIEALKKV